MAGYFTDIREIELAHHLPVSREIVSFADILRLISPSISQTFSSFLDQYSQEVFLTLTAAPQNSDLLEGRGLYHVHKRSTVYVKGVGNANAAAANPDWILPGYSAVRGKLFIDNLDNPFHVPRLYGTDFKSNTIKELTCAARLLSGHLDAQILSPQESVAAGFALPINCAERESVTSPRNRKLHDILSAYALADYPAVGSVACIVPTHMRAISVLYADASIPYSKFQEPSELAISADYHRAMQSLNRAQVYENVGRTMREGILRSALSMIPHGNHLQDYYAVGTPANLVFAERANLLQLECLEPMEREFLVGLSFQRLMDNGLRSTAQIAHLARKNILRGLVVDPILASKYADCWESSRWDVSYGIAKGLLRNLSASTLRTMAGRSRMMERDLERVLDFQTQGFSQMALASARTGDLDSVAMPGIYKYIGTSSLRDLDYEELMNRITTSAKDRVASEVAAATRILEPV